MHTYVHAHIYTLNIIIATLSHAGPPWLLCSDSPLAELWTRYTSLQAPFMMKVVSALCESFLQSVWQRAVVYKISCHWCAGSLAAVQPNSPILPPSPLNTASAHNNMQRISFSTGTEFVMAMTNLQLIEQCNPPSLCLGDLLLTAQPVCWTLSVVPFLCTPAGSDQVNTSACSPCQHSLAINMFAIVCAMPAFNNTREVTSLTTVRVV